MKKVGLIGGTSPESTVDYYRKINHLVNKSLGGRHSAKIVMVSVDFEEIVAAIFSEEWSVIFEIIKEACLTLQSAGVDKLALCSNTLHKVHLELGPHINTPILHILDPVIEVINEKRIRKVLMIGTSYTMKGSFHQNYFQKRCNLDVVVPPDLDMMRINDFIFNCLCTGIWSDNDSNEILAIVRNSIEHEMPDAILLGCTELSHFFEKIHLPIPKLDTTDLHCRVLSDFICGKI